MRLLGGVAACVAGLVTTLHDNPNVGFQTAGYPGIFFLGKGHPIVVHSTIN
jgi:hypothetical protein